MADRHPEFFEGTEMPDAGWWHALWPAPRDVLIAVGMRSGMEAIDLCCGDGWFTLEMAGLARHVTAVDIDPGLLDAARMRLSQHNVNNCSFVLGSAYDLAQLVPHRAGLVFMANSFHGVHDKARLCQAVPAALAPAGRLRW
jgi:ubiquinone/menaquinone biosynthesis C-methylase UbiE